MKNLYTFLTALLITATTFAQAPEKMSYQAVVRDSGDALVTNQAVGMQISILQTSATGTAVYVETQTPATNVNGLVTLEIGTGSAVSGDFTTIDWSANTYFIKTETDPTGGTSYSITGTSQLLSVPYALHAKSAEYAVIDNVDDADASPTNEIQNIEDVLTTGNNANGNSIVNTGNIGVGTANPNAETSIEVATPLPILFPKMTQAQVDAIATPVEGMVQYNTTAKKMQTFLPGSTYTGGNSVGVSFGYSDHTQGNTFKIPTTAILSTISASIANPASNPTTGLTVYSMKVYDSQGGTLLATASNTTSGEPNDYPGGIFDFSAAGLTLNANTSYYFEITSDNASNFYLYASYSNNYTLGEMYVNGAFNANADITFSIVANSSDAWVDLH